MLDLKNLITDSASGLYEIVLAITGRCNLHCSFCYSNSILNNPELSFAVVKDIFEQGKQLGVQVMALSGGEPFLHASFRDIVELACSSFNVVMISSNGYFITRDIALYLRNVGVSNVQLSIEGEEKVHNKLRGDSNSFQKAKNALIYLRELGVDVTLTPTLQEKNCDNIFYVWELAKEFGADLSIKRVINTGRAKHVPVLTPNEYKHLYDFAFEQNALDLNSKIFIHCDPLRVLYKDKERLRMADGIVTGCIAGFSLLYVRYDGRIFPCSKLPIQVGNIQNDTIKDILQNSKIINDLSNRKKLTGKCGRCEYKFLCGGCRAAGYAVYDNIFAEDHMCWRTI